MDGEGNATCSVGIGLPVTIWADVELESVDTTLVMGVELRTQEGVPVLNLRTDSQSVTFGPYNMPAAVRMQVRIPGLPLYPGIYIVDVWVGSHKGKRIDHLRRICRIVLEERGVYQSETFLQQGRGIILIDCGWDAEELKQTISQTGESVIAARSD
jgi:hypothetical protein